MVWLASCAGLRPIYTPQARLNFELAEVLVAHHAHAQAMPLLQQALVSDPNNPRLHNMLGLVLRDRGLYAQAEAELLLADRLAPRDADTVTALGVLYDQWGKHAQALHWHETAVVLRPNSPDAYNNLGFSLALDNRLTAAVVAYNEALRRDPHARRVFNNLGFVKARLHDYAGAMHDFEQAGGKAVAYANMGLAYELANEPASAKSFYEEALQLDPSLSTTKKNLQALLQRLQTAASTADRS